MSNNYKGYDPYDLLESKFLKNINNYRIVLFLSHLCRLSPINLRKFISIKKIINSKAMALIFSSLINLDQYKYSEYLEYIKNWLIENKSNYYKEYSIGFTFDIILSNYSSKKNFPSLIITLFVMYALIEFYKKTNDQIVYKLIITFKNLVENKLNKYENEQYLYFSYNFEQENEIYNSTAKIGKFYSLLYMINGDKKLIDNIKKILNYLYLKQRDDGSWAYGEKIRYTDGFHTAFVLESIWYMRKLVDSNEFKRMYLKGLNHYKNNMFLNNGQPLYFHPKYSPKDIRKYIIKTDIRDCAMAIILFSKIGKIDLAENVLEWTLSNMYNQNKGYFYYYRNQLWTNKIEFIRWQAWMLYALTEFIKANEKN